MTLSFKSLFLEVAYIFKDSAYYLTCCWSICFIKSVKSTNLWFHILEEVSFTHCYYPFFSFSVDASSTSLPVLPFCLYYRSKSLALHTVLTKSMSSDDGEVVESGDTPASIFLSEIDPLSQGNDKLPFKANSDRSQPRNSSLSHPSIMHTESENLPGTVKENCQEETPETTASPVEYQDKLYLHLKENFSKVKAYAVEIGKKIPVPDQCTIEGKFSEHPKLEKFQTSLVGGGRLAGEAQIIKIAIP